MDSYERIATAFHTRIDCIASAVDSLAPGIEAGSDLLTRAVLEDRKILVCATAMDAPLAQFVAQLLRDDSGDTPPLPAMALTADQGESNEATLWRDLRTLSRDGDVLLCIDTGDDGLLAARAAEVASQRNLSLLALSNTEAQATNQAVTVPLDAPSRALRRELLLMATDCLLLEIRKTLLGE